MFGLEGRIVFGEFFVTIHVFQCFGRASHFLLFVCQCYLCWLWVLVSAANCGCYLTVGQGGSRITQLRKVYSVKRRLRIERDNASVSLGAQASIPAPGSLRSLFSRYVSFLGLILPIVHPVGQRAGSRSVIVCQTFPQGRTIGFFRM
jgi:hypothetical protein